jgi:uncharacterized membrane protein YfcA
MICSMLLLFSLHTAYAHDSSTSSVSHVYMSDGYIIVPKNSDVSSSTSSVPTLSAGNIDDACTEDGQRLDCGDQLVCMNAKCALCTSTSQCLERRVCTDSGTCERPSLLSTAKTADVIATCLAFVGAMLAAGGGLGGGGLFVPIFVLIIGLDPKDAVPLSQAMIFGGSLVNLAIYLRETHPYFPDRPVIDFHAVLVLQPLLLAGTIIGVWLNIMFPSWLIVGLLAVTLFIASYRTTRKGVRMWKIEGRKRRSRSRSNAGVESSDDESSQSEPESDAEIEHRSSDDDVDEKVLEMYGRLASASETPNVRSPGLSDDENDEVHVPTPAPRLIPDTPGPGTGPDGAISTGTTAATATVAVPVATRNNGVVQATDDDDVFEHFDDADNNDDMDEDTNNTPRLRTKVENDDESHESVLSRGSTRSDAEERGVPRQRADGSIAIEMSRPRSHSERRLESAATAALRARQREEKLATFLEGYYRVWPSLCWIGVIWAVVLLSALIRGGKAGSASVAGIEGCTVVYWIVSIVTMLALLSITWVIGNRLQKSYHTKNELGYNFRPGEIQWTRKNAMFYPLLATLAGILGGLVGIGGGMIMGPLLLELGMLSQPTSATSAATVFLTASSAAVQYFLLDLLILDYALWFGVVGFLATFVGQTFINYLVRRYKRTSLIVLSIALVLVLALVMMVTAGIVQVLKDIDEDKPMGFGGLCEDA